ncbi:MAG: hypothetical protein ABIE23_02615 [archaeon]|nr:hypothetical protein [Candidatus Micrarchaeota archaeon]
MHKAVTKKRNHKTFVFCKGMHIPKPKKGRFYVRAEKLLERSVILPEQIQLLAGAGVKTRAGDYVFMELKEKVAGNPCRDLELTKKYGTVFLGKIHELGYRITHYQTREGFFRELGKDAATHEPKQINYAAPIAILGRPEKGGKRTKKR